MQISKAALGTVTAACVAVGAAGAYLVSHSPGDVAPGQPVALAVRPSEAAAPIHDAGPAEAPRPAVVPAQVESTPAPQPVAVARVATRRHEMPSSEVSVPADADTSNPVTTDGDALIPDNTHEESRAAAAARGANPPNREMASTAAADPPQPASAPPPTDTEFTQLVIATDAVIGLRLDTSVSSEHARVEDRVTARVTRDVRVGDRVAIPSGATAYGEVTIVERGGRLHDRARVGVCFTSIVLADGTRVPIETDAIIREGSSPSSDSAAKIGGGALGAAIIGGVLGGRRGAVIGGAAGAGAGTAVVLAGGRSAAVLAAGAPVTVRLGHPATVTVDR